jgi:hypothetical protein
MARVAGQWSVAVLLMLGMAGIARPACAQTPIVAVAVVQPGVAVLGTRTLDFGNVFPGVDKTIGIGSGTAGLYRIDGADNAPVSLSFTLPSNLVRTAGGNLLPISSWTALHNEENDPSSGVNFTPSAASTGIILGLVGRRWVFIGATVSPAVNQLQGTYSAVATLSVVYM